MAFIRINPESEQDFNELRLPPSKLGRYSLIKDRQGSKIFAVQDAILWQLEECGIGYTEIDKDSIENEIHPDQILGYRSMKEKSPDKLWLTEASLPPLGHVGVRCRVAHEMSDQVTKLVKRFGVADIQAKNSVHIASGTSDSKKALEFFISRSHLSKLESELFERGFISAAEPLNFQVLNPDR